MRALSLDRFHELAVHTLGKAGLDTNRFPLAYVKAALDTCQGKLRTFAELPAYAGFYFSEVTSYDPAAAARDFTPENLERLRRLRTGLARVETFQAGPLEACLKQTAAELGVKAGVLVHPTRLACTGRPAGPSLYHLMEVLGKDTVLARLDRVLAPKPAA
ncbi:MAG: hypothetical protein M5U12_16210 [Verrucomicrobia bacterium]|nr:hypothetical protein [Verrucomicrobiota bacterium]